MKKLSILVMFFMLTGCAFTRLAPDQASERRHLIEAARLSGNPEFALLIARRHAEENPDNIQALDGLGGLLLEQGYCQEASDVLHRADAVASQTSERTKRRARSYLQCGQFAKALRVLDDYGTGLQQDMDMLNMKGVALDKMKNHEAAQKTYREALAIQPGQKVTYNLAMSLLLSGHHRESFMLLPQIREQAGSDPDVEEQSIVFLEAVYLLAEDREADARMLLLSSAVPDDEVTPLLAQLKEKLQ